MNGLKRLLAFLLMLLLASCCALAEDSWLCFDCETVNQYNFCINCGAPKPQERVCQGCGYVNEYGADAAFCTECGLPYGQAPAEPEDEFEPDSEPDFAPAEEDA